MTPRILIAGIGNVFLGDDGFGVEVVRRLAQHPLPDGVQVTDFGIRGFDLALALLHGYDTVILVDAIRRGGPPGSVYVLEPDLDSPANVDSQDLLVEAHALDPMKVFGLVKAMGGRLPHLRLVGCEPTTTAEDHAMKLSDVVQASADQAVEVIASLLAEMLSPDHEN